MRVEQLHTARQGVVDERLAVDEQTVEERRRQGKLAPKLVDLELPSEAPHRDLERLRRTIGPEGYHLAVENQLTGRERARGLHDLGDGVRHVAKVSREDTYLVVQLVDLDSGAIELVLDRSLTDLVQRLTEIGSRLGKHRLHRPHRLDDERVDRGSSFGQRSRGDVRQRPRQHGGAPNDRRGNRCGLRHGLEQDALQRPLAKLAEEQPNQKVLLDGGRPPKQLPEQRGA